MSTSGAASGNSITPGTAYQELGSDGAALVWKNRTRTPLAVGQQAAVSSIATSASLLDGGNIPTMFADGELAVGDVIRVTGAGTFNNTSGGAAVMYVYVVLAANPINCTLTTISVVSGAGVRRWWFDLSLTIAAVGTTPTQWYALTSDVSAAGASLWVVANSVLTSGSQIIATSGAVVDFDLRCNSNVNNAATTARCDALAVVKVCK